MIVANPYHSLVASCATCVSSVPVGKLGDATRSRALDAQLFVLRRPAQAAQPWTEITFLLSFQNLNFIGFTTSEPGNTSSTCILDEAELERRKAMVLSSKSSSILEIPYGQQPIRPR